MTTIRFFILLSFVVFANGQDTILIQKAELLQKLTQNLQLKTADYQVASAKADYNQSKALFLPNVTASHTALTTTNPLMAFGSKLNQERISMADFNPDLLNNPAQVQNYATRIEVLQPLINVDGYFERRAAKIQIEAYTSKRTNA